MIERLRRLFAGRPSPATPPPGPSHAASRAAPRQDDDIAARLAALERTADGAALLQAALHDRVARVRIAAAGRLQDPADLERLRRESNDKAVQRIARERLRELREREQAAQDMRERITRLLVAIEQHAARSLEPLYEAKLDSLVAAWREVAGQAGAADQERFAELAALARDAVARQAAEAAARTAAIDARLELIAACNELESLVRRLQEQDLTAELAAVAALRSTQQVRWDEAARLATPDAPQAARFRAATRLLDQWLAAVAELPRAGQDAAPLFAAIADTEHPSLEQLDDWQALLDALRARLDWPGGCVAAGLLSELDEAARRLTARRRALQADLRDQLAQLRKRRGALRHMIDDGQLRVAVRTHQWLQKRIAELPAREAAQESAALVPLTEALARLHDWYEFASVPKKTELCVQVEALAAAPLDDIGARAAAVRELRSRWNALCAADPEADPALRTRFDQAADAAFAPCAAWYEAQHRLQDENLRQRAALCDAMAAELDQVPADAAAWRACEQRERELRAQWKSLEPVRWPEARSTQERFHALLVRWRARLDAERQRNAARRRELVEQARALLQREPLDAALRAARDLQDAWKQAGWTDPREDRALWQEFRAACDAVFARRDAARDAERQAREAAAAEQARQRSAEAARREERAAALQAARQAEIDVALAVAAFEEARLAGDAVDPAELSGRLDALPRSPLQAALRARLQAGATDPAALAAGAERLANLTLELEILLDVPSPPELSAARMQARIGQLNTALRQRGAPAADARRALEDQWLGVGPVPAAARAPLLARFLAARAAAG